MRLVLLLLAFFVLLPQSLLAGESVRMPLPAEIKDSLPWFAVREIRDNNTPFTKTHLQQLAKKNSRVALVYFATWCIPCRAGLKQIALNQQEIQSAGTAIVLVNVGERDTEKVRLFLKKASAGDIPAITDPYGRMTEAFGLVKEGQTIVLPKTIIVDSDVKPMLLVGEEGCDYLKILKGE